jgi:hypothetical protein
MTFTTIDLEATEEEQQGGSMMHLREEVAIGQMPGRAEPVRMYHAS